ncbi:MAG: type II secretion system protein [Clostridiales bacterium]|nr:type II secretion system protein [Clostridiales bacterium]
MRGNNKGLTLVELLVSITIAGVLIVAAFSFMVSSSNIFKNLDIRKNLHMDSQLAANLIESYVIDCNENIYFSGDSLFVINHESGEYIAHVFEGSGNSLNYAMSSAKKKPDGSYSCSYKAEDFICGNLENFSVEIFPLDFDKVSFVELKISLEKNGVKQDIKKTIALRNKVTTKIVNFEDNET